MEREEGSLTTNQAIGSGSRSERDEGRERERGEEEGKR